MDSKISTTGVLMTRYRKKGRVEIGLVALEDPTDDEVKRRRRWRAEGEASLASQRGHEGDHWVALGLQC